jgi:hypothetical protein
MTILRNELGQCPQVPFFLVTGNANFLEMKSRVLRWKTINCVIVHENLKTPVCHIFIPGSIGANSKAVCGFNLPASKIIQHDVPAVVVFSDSDV